tara:strand:- start:318 stop:1721 length:1404 start_codon:yes stop_codon:yes gene_type:complete
MFKALGDIADMLTDEEVLGGIATGISEQIDYSQKRADKAEERLNDWAMNRAEREANRYRDEIKENEDQVKVLAAKLSDEDFASNSKEVLSAAQYLIQNYGLAGAQDEANKLYKEKTEYGTNPLKTLAVNAGNDASQFTFSKIAAGLTARPSKINLAESGIKIRQSFTDKLFGNDYTEDIQASLDAASAGLPADEALPNLAKTGYDAELIIRADKDIGSEIARFKKLNAETQKTDPTNQGRMDLIKGKIELLKKEKIFKNIGEATSLTSAEYNRLGNLLIKEIGVTYGLDIKGDVLSGDLISFEQSNENTQAAMLFVTRAKDDLNAIQESGNPYIIGEMTKLNAAIAQNRDYEIETDEYGVKSIKLVEEKQPLLRGFSTAPTDSTIPDDPPANNLPSNSSAYTDPPADTASTPAIDAAVAAFKNLPDDPDPSARDKQNARRAIQNAVRAAFPNLNPDGVANKVEALLR